MDSSHRARKGGYQKLATIYGWLSELLKVSNSCAVCATSSIEVGLRFYDVNRLSGMSNQVFDR